MTDYEIAKQAETPTIGIRKTIPMDQMQQFFSDSYSQLFHWIESNHRGSAGR